jgi:hypothetical protein
MTLRQPPDKIHVAFCQACGWWGRIDQAVRVCMVCLPKGVHSPLRSVRYGLLRRRPQPK